jgi:ASC-1-like (ASCH) protein
MNNEIVEFVIKIDRKWFDAIVAGLKTVEGKCLKNPDSTASRILQAWLAGHDGRIIVLIFRCKDDEVRKVLTDITRHSSILEMLKHHGLENALPGVTDLLEGLAIYEKYYSLELQETGVIGLVLGDIQ